MSDNFILSPHLSSLYLQLDSVCDLASWCYYADMALESCEGGELFDQI